MSASPWARRGWASALHMTRRECCGSTRSAAVPRRPGWVHPRALPPGADRVHAARQRACLPGVCPACACVPFALAAVRQALTPACSFQIRMDDILVSVDDMPCMHSPADTASLLLAGPQGSFVSVRVQRGGIQHDFLLRRTFKLADDAPASKHEQWSKCETALSAEDVPTPAVGVDEVRSCLSVSPSQSGLSLGPVRRGILKSGRPYC